MGHNLFTGGGPFFSRGEKISKGTLPLEKPPFFSPGGKKSPARCANQKKPPRFQPRGGFFSRATRSPHTLFSREKTVFPKGESPKRGSPGSPILGPLFKKRVSSPQNNSGACQNNQLQSEGRSPPQKKSVPHAGGGAQKKTLERKTPRRQEEGVTPPGGDKHPTKNAGGKNPPADGELVARSKERERHYSPTLE